MALTAMKPLNVRFSNETKDRIKSVAGDNKIAESLVARAALNLGLGIMDSAKDDMTGHEFILFLDDCQRKI